MDIMTLLIGIFAFGSGLTLGAAWEGARRDERAGRNL